MNFTDMVNKSMKNKQYGKNQKKLTTIRLKVYCDGILVKTWEGDIYEVIFENGYEVVYIEKDGIRTRAVTVGNFGYSTWSYEVEYI